MANSNLPSTKRFYSEDYQGSTPWFQRFLGQLNLFTEPMYNVLNGSVDLTINTNEEIYSLQVNNASATGSSNTFTFTPQKFVGAPHGILIGQCLLNSTTGIASAIGNPVTLDWVWTGSQVSILAIYGLTAAASYTFSLRIY